ncbi:MAG: DNA-processing protein DprA [Hyphomicrobiales bacterium]|nr:DNA-processing protein DprA [Hyphomicrobiales bacterium]
MSNLVFENSKIDREPFRINLDDARYPNRVKVIMGKNAPKHLDMVGNIKLLDMAGLGLCGSRHATDKSLEIARDCAEQAAQNNVSVVSGNAAGVDFKSHFNCLEAGGKTILVIPEGMNHFRIRKDLQPVWDWERVLVVSQFDVDKHWGKYRAMKRNQLVLALSRVMIVVESGEKGGSLNTGKEALKHDIPLYVTQHQDMSVSTKGNRILLKMGARKLSKSRSSSRANLVEVFKSVEEDEVLKNFSGKHVKFELRPTVPK